MIDFLLMNMFCVAFCASVAVTPSIRGTNLLDRGHEVIISAVRGWHPNKTAVEEKATKVEESLKMLTANDMIILHLIDNISYMARSEEEDLSFGQCSNGEFHVEGDLILASKDWLFMFFRNVLPCFVCWRASRLSS